MWPWFSAPQISLVVDNWTATTAFKHLSMRSEIQWQILTSDIIILLKSNFQWKIQLKISSVLASVCRLVEILVNLSLIFFLCERARVETKVFTSANPDWEPTRFQSEYAHLKKAGKCKWPSRDCSDSALDWLIKCCWFSRPITTPNGKKLKSPDYRPLPSTEYCTVDMVPNW